MAAATSDQTERLVQFSRRQLWTVLIFLLLLGGASLVDMFFVVNIPPALNVVLTILAVLAGSFTSKTKGLDFSKSNPAMLALRNDELRQLAQARAFRNGFFVLLAYPPVCAFALTWLAVANPLPLVVESGAWLGAVVCLASLLWYDR